MTIYHIVLLIVIGGPLFGILFQLSELTYVLMQIRDKIK